MPLVPCPDCKREVSDLAVSCPGCGCPVKSLLAHARDVDGAREAAARSELKRAAIPIDPERGIDLSAELAAIERQTLVEALLLRHGSMTAAGLLLGLSPRQVKYLVMKYPQAAEVVRQFRGGMTDESIDNGDTG